MPTRKAFAQISSDNSRISSKKPSSYTTALIRRNSDWCTRSLDVRKRRKIGQRSFSLPRLPTLGLCEVRPAPLQNPFVSSAVVSELSFHRTVGFHLCCQCDPFHHIPIKLPKLTVCKLHRTHLSCVHCELDHGDNRSRAEAKRFS